MMHVTYWFFQADCEVNHRHVGGGHTEGHAGQFAAEMSVFKSQTHLRTADKNPLRGTHPFSSGMTFPTALAAPVEAGMMFWLAPRPSLHSLPEGPSTVFWVAVMA